MPAPEIANAPPAVETVSSVTPPPVALTVNAPVPASEIVPVVVMAPAVLVALNAPLPATEIVPPVEIEPAVTANPPLPVVIELLVVNAPVAVALNAPVPAVMVIGLLTVIEVLDSSVRLVALAGVVTAPPVVSTPVIAPALLPTVRPV